MNPFLWLQTLVTFRKNGGGLQVPELDAGGRIRVSLLSDPGVSVGATPPSTVDGSVLWLNTNAGYEGLYFRDQTRNKWLSTSEVGYGYGQDSADNQILRMNSISTPAATCGNYLPRDGTIVAVAVRAVGGVPNKGMQVRVNGASVLSFALSSSEYVNLTVDQNFSAGQRLDVFVEAPAGPVNDVAADVFVRWRDS